MTPGEHRPPRPDEEPRVAAPSLVLIGLVLGLAGALTYAWIVNPLVYTQAGPAGLSSAFQEEYVLLVSQSYAVDGRWDVTLARLGALGQPDLPAFMEAQLTAALRQGRDQAQVRQLAAVAARLGAGGQAVALFAPATPGASPTPDVAVVPTLTPTLLPTLTPVGPPTATPTPAATFTPAPTATATPRPAFELQRQQRVCRAREAVTEIQVLVLDAESEPLAGVEVLVSWDGGADRFFTGFKPGESPGYGDFTMVRGVSYRVTLPAGSPTVSGLSLEDCDTLSGGLPGGWRLTFQKVEE